MFILTRKIDTYFGKNRVVKVYFNKLTNVIPSTILKIYITLHFTNEAMFQEF